jgi:hypothetical protein
VLDYLATARHVRSLALIGGTNLRLAKGIDRFSQDLDFDCKSFSEEQFRGMSEDVLVFLKRNGLKAELRNKDSGKLTALRSSIHFPGHWDERFMPKLESQDQGVAYGPMMGLIKGCGLFFSRRILQFHEFIRALVKN